MAAPLRSGPAQWKRRRLIGSNCSLGGTRSSRDKLPSASHAVAEAPKKGEMKLKWRVWRRQTLSAFFAGRAENAEKCVCLFRWRHKCFITLLLAPKNATWGVQPLLEENKPVKASLRLG